MGHGLHARQPGGWHDLSSHVDLYSRECLAAVACRSFSGADVASVLAVVGIDRGALPKKIRVDNGTEFTPKTLDHWAY